MRPYHPDNVKAQPFPAWRVIALAWLSKALGIQFKIDGIPYGAPYRKDLWPPVDNTEGASGIDSTHGVRQLEQFSNIAT